MQIIFGLLGVGVFLAAMSMHGSAMAFVDLASLCFVVGGTVLFSLAHIPFSDIKGAFKLAFAQGPIQRKDAQRPISVLSTIRILASASGVLGILVGVVKMLQSMDDPSAIGPAMAVALLTPMYAIIMAELLIGPAIGRLNARIDDDAPSAPPLKSSLVTTAAIPMVGIAFVVMLVSVMPL